MVPRIIESALIPLGPIRFMILMGLLSFVGIRNSGAHCPNGPNGSPDIIIYLANSKLKNFGFFI